MDIEHKYHIKKTLLKSYTKNIDYILLTKSEQAEIKNILDDNRLFQKTITKILLITPII